MFNSKSSALVNSKLLSSITLPLIPGAILQRFAIYKNRTMVGGPVGPFNLSSSRRDALLDQTRCLARHTLWASLFHITLPLQQNCSMNHSLQTPFTFTLFPKPGSTSSYHSSPPRAFPTSPSLIGLPLRDLPCTMLYGDPSPCSLLVWVPHVSKPGFGSISLLGD